MDEVWLLREKQRLTRGAASERRSTPRGKPRNLPPHRHSGSALVSPVHSPTPEVSRSSLRSPTFDSTDSSQLSVSPTQSEFSYGKGFSFPKSAHPRQPVKAEKGEESPGPIYDPKYHFLSK